MWALSLPEPFRYSAFVAGLLSMCKTRHSLVAHWDAAVGSWLARQSLAESRVQLHSTHSRAVARHPAIGNTRTSGIGCSRKTQPRTYTVHSSVKGRDARSRSSSLPRQRTRRVARRDARQAASRQAEKESGAYPKRKPETWPHCSTCPRWLWM